MIRARLNHTLTGEIMTTHPASAISDRVANGGHSTAVKWAIIPITLSLLVALIAVAYSRSYIGHRDLDLDEGAHVSQCEAEVLNEISPKPSTIDLAVLASVHTFCYQKVSEADVLTDFGIRKSAYLNQQIQTTILMWMVVAITLSGVFLAALQRVAAYKLAASGKS